MLSGKTVNWQSCLHCHGEAGQDTPPPPPAAAKGSGSRPARRLEVRSPSEGSARPLTARSAAAPGSLHPRAEPGREQQPELGRAEPPAAPASPSRLRPASPPPLLGRSPPAGDSEAQLRTHILPRGRSRCAPKAFRRDPTGSASYPAAPGCDVTGAGEPRPQGGARGGVALERFAHSGAGTV